MPIIPQWEDNEKTIIKIEFVDKWTWQEFGDTRTQISAMVKSVPHIVDFLVDFEEIEQIPIGALAVGRSLHNNRLPNKGTAVLVGVAPIIRMLYRSFIAAYPTAKHYLVLVDSMEEARHILTEIKKNRQ